MNSKNNINNIMKTVNKNSQQLHKSNQSSAKKEAWLKAAQQATTSKAKTKQATTSKAKTKDDLMKTVNKNSQQLHKSNKSNKTLIVKKP